MAFLSPEEEAEMLEYVDEVAKALGLYWPEELHQRTFGIGLKLANAAIDIEDGIKQGSKELEKFSELGDNMLQLAGVLFRKIPVDKLEILDREYRRFWQGEGTEESPKARHGLYPDWAVATLIHFQGRPLAYADIGKILFAEKYDDTSKNLITTRVVGIVTSESGLKSITTRLNPLDLKIQNLAIRYPTGHRKDPRILCVPNDTYISLKDVDESQRPTDEELRNLAIILRKEELVRQKAKAGERETRMTELAWQSRQRSPTQRDIQRKQREVDASWVIHDRILRTEQKEVEKSAKREISEWRRSDNAIEKSATEARRNTGTKTEINQKLTDTETKYQRRRNGQKVAASGISNGALLSDLVSDASRTPEEVSEIHAKRLELKLGAGILMATIPGEFENHELDLLRRLKNDEIIEDKEVEELIRDGFVWLADTIKRRTNQKRKYGY